MNDKEDNKFRLKLAGDWLLRCQRANNDGGYAAFYSLWKGWSKSYPETTGYIIPTMLSLADFLNEDIYRLSAIRAGQWLLQIQRSNGAFLDLSGRPQVFDTGQIIEGFLALYNTNGDECYLHAAKRAGIFLVETQEKDGAWTKYSFNNVPHTYYSRVAANLLKLSDILNDAYFRNSAKLHLQWVMKQQKENGYFRYMAFSVDELPYLHTIVYVLEGLFESYKMTKNEGYYACLMRTVNELFRLNTATASKLFSQYDENWISPNKEKCTVGLAQWAGLLLNIYSLSKDKLYMEASIETINYLKNKQVLKSIIKNIIGALPGSIPIWGRYFRFSFNNWTVKFFIDSLIQFEHFRIKERFDG